MNGKEVKQPRLITMGFLNGDRIREGEVKSTTIDDNLSGYDGKKLDNLFVQADLETQQDFDNLIRFLRIQKHCFTK